MAGRDGFELQFSDDGKFLYMLSYKFIKVYEERDGLYQLKYIYYPSYASPRMTTFMLNEDTTMGIIADGYLNT